MDSKPIGNYNSPSPPAYQLPTTRSKTQNTDPGTSRQNSFEQSSGPMIQSHPATTAGTNRYHYRSALHSGSSESDAARRKYAELGGTDKEALLEEYNANQDIPVLATDIAVITKVDDTDFILLKCDLLMDTATELVEQPETLKLVLAAARKLAKGTTTLSFDANGRADYTMNITGDGQYRVAIQREGNYVKRLAIFAGKQEVIAIPLKPEMPPRLFAFSGNKYELMKRSPEARERLRAGVHNTERMIDGFGGIAYYPTWLSAQGILPPKLTINEASPFRYIILSQLVEKGNRDLVLGKLEQVCYRALQASYRTLNNKDMTAQVDPATLENWLKRSFSEDERHKCEAAVKNYVLKELSTQWPEDKKSPVNTPYAAALAIFVQLCQARSGLPQEILPQPADANGITVKLLHGFYFVMLGKPTEEDAGRVIRRTLDRMAVSINKMSELFSGKNVEVTRRDAWLLQPFLGERDLLTIDPSYLLREDQKSSKTPRYMLGNLPEYTAEGCATKIRAFMPAWARGTKIKINNRWNSDLAELLTELGFDVSKKINSPQGLEELVASNYQWRDWRLKGSPLLPLQTYVGKPPAPLALPASADAGQANQGRPFEKKEDLSDLATQPNLGRSYRQASYDDDTDDDIEMDDSASAMEFFSVKSDDAMDVDTPLVTREFFKSEFALLGTALDQLQSEFTCQRISDQESEKLNFKRSDSGAWKASDPANSRHFELAPSEYLSRIDDAIQITIASAHEAELDTLVDNELEKELEPPIRFASYFENAAELDTQSEDEPDKAVDREFLRAAVMLSRHGVDATAAALGAFAEKTSEPIPLETLHRYLQKYHANDVIPTLCTDGAIPWESNSSECILEYKDDNGAARHIEFQQNWVIRNRPDEDEPLGIAGADNKRKLDAALLQRMQQNGSVTALHIWKIPDTSQSAQADRLASLALQYQSEPRRSTRRATGTLEILEGRKRNLSRSPPPVASSSRSVETKPKKAKSHVGSTKPKKQKGIEHPEKPRATPAVPVAAPTPLTISASENDALTPQQNPLNWESSILPGRAEIFRKFLNFAQQRRPDITISAMSYRDFVLLRADYLDEKEMGRRSDGNCTSTINNAAKDLYGHAWLLQVCTNAGGDGALTVGPGLDFEAKLMKKTPALSCAMMKENPASFQAEFEKHLASVGSNNNSIATSMLWELKANMGNASNVVLTSVPSQDTAPLIALDCTPDENDNMTANLKDWKSTDKHAATNRNKKIAHFISYMEERQSELKFDVRKVPYHVFVKLRSQYFENLKAKPDKRLTGAVTEMAESEYADTWLIRAAKSRSQSSTSARLDMEAKLMTRDEHPTSFANLVGATGDKKDAFFSLYKETWPTRHIGVLADSRKDLGINIASLNKLQAFKREFPINDPDFHRYIASFEFSLQRAGFDLADPCLGRTDGDAERRASLLQIYNQEMQKVEAQCYYAKANKKTNVPIHMINGMKRQLFPNETSHLP
jgi:hypothetical protein